MQFNTLAEAKAWLREEAKGKGARCPCCNQHVKFYKRKLNSAMAVCLIALFRELKKTGAQYLHIQHMISVNRLFAAKMHGGNFATLKYWGLISEKPKEEDKDTRTSGMWGVTELGERFIQGRISVPKYVWTYNMQEIRFKNETPENISIREALGDHFSYSEMMDAPL